MPVCLFPSLVDFHQTWYERYDIGADTNTALFNFIVINKNNVVDVGNFEVGWHNSYENCRLCNRSI